MSDIAARKAAFAALLSCYHNSFTESVKGVFRHSLEFIRKVVSEGKKEALATDPRMTSTSEGAVAIAIAKQIMRNDRAAKNFIDIELAEGAFVVSFEKDLKADEAVAIVSTMGKTGVLARPKDKIGEGIISDILILAVEPTQQVAEAFLKEARSAVDEANVPDTAGDADYMPMASPWGDKDDRKWKMSVKPQHVAKSPDGEVEYRVHHVQSSAGKDIAANDSHAVVSYYKGRPHDTTYGGVEGFHMDFYTTPKDAIAMANKRASMKHKDGVRESVDEGVDEAKKPKLGTGKRFANLKKKLGKKGAKNPGALAAWIGRKKYGKKRFSNLSHHENAEADPAELTEDHVQAIYTHAYGVDAWAALDESSRADKALRHMVASFTLPGIPGAKTETGNAGFDAALKAAVATAKRGKMNETENFDEIVDDVAVAIHENFAGDFAKVIAATVRNTAVTVKDAPIVESTITDEAKAELLQAAARNLLLSVGIVPSSLSEAMAKWDEVDTLSISPADGGVETTSA